ncbi:hypothetical protein [Bradyrhizobium tunisiense]|uniref:hypothetical protein n=1 Tax=Bradyrhizobium tunisiense TaxID=3278709 RepID=UPI0035D9E6B4
MAGRFNNPFPQFLDATPAVRSGAKLFFYEAGTSTKLNTYSDRNLSSANTNPIVLNSAGYPSVDIFLQDLDYKVVLAPSTDTDPPANPIWTADYVNARDSKLIAKTLTGSGSPNGSVAGTAGSSSILPDFYWDYTNSILYVCTTTGTSTTAVWTAVNASAATPSVPPPQGRLTPTSATPVINSNAAVQVLYYTPYVGNLVPIYNGSTMVPTEFSEIFLNLAASHAASTIYDVFVFSNSGVLTLVTGPAWSSSTAGSCSRGTGASTTELTRVKGMWVNAVSMTGRNGSTTYTVGANNGTYLGSIFMDATPGQLTCHVDWGQARKWGIWNAYNRKQVFLKGGDTTATWTTAPVTWRQSRADANNYVYVFAGLPEESYDLRFSQLTQSAVGVSTSDAQVAIGFNSTSSPSGRQAQQLITSSANNTLRTMLAAEYNAPPSLGLQKINALEQSVNGATNNDYYGTESFMLLSARYYA